MFSTKDLSSKFVRLFCVWGNMKARVEPARGIRAVRDITEAKVWKKARNVLLAISEKWGKQKIGWTQFVCLPIDACVHCSKTKVRFAVYGTFN